MSEVKLLPCPFCAGEKINFVDSIEEYKLNLCIYEKYLQCDCCGNRSLSVISSKPITEHGIEVLIEKWNTRKPINMIVKQLEEMETIYEKKYKEYKHHPMIYNYERSYAQAGAYKHAIDIVKGVV